MKLLMAVDGSQQALDAARHVLRRRARGLNADFVLGTVLEPTFLYEMVRPPTPEVMERLSGAVGHRALEGAEALFCAAGVPFEHEFGSSEVAPTLMSIAHARGCDGIVLGARGPGAGHGALLGSVSPAILQATAVQLTVVRRIEAEGPV